ncbi:MAG: MBL fold metallo-hydrolase [Bacteroidales bacterium]|nr:MBL fold metallo-hydrolase [Bacteroidales bacterium]
MKLHVLGSSSSGNCYIFQSEKTGEMLAVEAGMDFHKVVLRATNFAVDNIVGCLVTHEHGDHAAYAHCFAEFGINVYGSHGTVEAIQAARGKYPYYRSLAPLAPVRIGSYEVMPFPVQHDAVEPFGYLIRHEECGTVLFATDTYYIKYTFPRLNNILLECNYRKDILDTNYAAGRIGKNRYERTIKSHMSYDMCVRTLQANDLSLVRHIILLHMSDNNSNADEFVRGIEAIYPDIEVTAATRRLTLTINKNPY